MRRFLLMLVGVALGGSCEEAAEGGTDTSVEVSWSGCASEVGRGTCELAQKPLTVWVPELAEAWSWTLGDAPLTPTSSALVDGGVRLTFEVSTAMPGALALIDQEGAQAFSLMLEPYALEPSSFEWGGRYRELAGSKDVRARRALAEELAAGVGRAATLEALSRLHHAAKLWRNRGDPADEVAELRALLDREKAMAERLGRTGEVCEAVKMQVFLDTAVSTSGGDESWRAWSEACSRHSPSMAAKFDFFVGVHALRRGRYGEAEARLRRVRTFASRTGNAFLLPSRERLLELFVDTGRWREARAEIDALETAQAPRCRRGILDADLGAVRVAARLRGDADLGDPRPGLLRALEVHAPGGACESSLLYHHDLIKLGYVDALDEDANALGARLRVLEAATLYEKYPLQRAELRVHEALLRESPQDTRRALSQMADEMGEGTEPEARWRYNMLAARLAELVEDHSAAVEAYRAAEAVLDHLWQRVRSGAVREQWFGSYHSSALRLMETLVELGDAEAAACAVRRARSRALERGGAPMLACDRPWAKHEGELVVLIVPDEHGAWRVFAIEDERVVDTRTVPAFDEKSDAARWWDPWGQWLGRASRVRLLASREAMEVPLHRLGWEGEPLGLRHPVAWGLDLSERPSSAPATEGALVVFADADPLRTLARYEGEVLAGMAELADAGWSTQYAGREVDLDLLTRSLPGAGLLHYYGHGLRDEEKVAAHQGELGTTALLLANGTRLDVGDIASARRVPRHVTLLGCDVGFADGHGWNGGLNLVHAFLLRGATEVLASSAPIEASHAAKLGATLYQHQSPEAIDLGRALHRAWKRGIPSRSEELWNDLRVWTP